MKSIHAYRESIALLAQQQQQLSFPPRATQDEEDRLSDKKIDPSAFCLFFFLRMSRVPALHFLSLSPSLGGPGAVGFFVRYKTIIWIIRLYIPFESAAQWVLKNSREKPSCKPTFLHVNVHQTELLDLYITHTATVIKAIQKKKKKSRTLFKVNGYCVHQAYGVCIYRKPYYIATCPYLSTNTTVWSLRWERNLKKHERRAFFFFFFRTFRIRSLNYLEYKSRNSNCKRQIVKVWCIKSRHARLTWKKKKKRRSTLCYILWLRADGDDIGDARSLFSLHSFFLQVRGTVTYYRYGTRQSPSFFFFTSDSARNHALQTFLS